MTNIMLPDPDDFDGWHQFCQGLFARWAERCGPDLFKDWYVEHAHSFDEPENLPPLTDEQLDEFKWVERERMKQADRELNPHLHTHDED